jgi:predicted nucleotide-binding protein
MAASEATQGGMVGSAHLVWPEDKEQELGLTLLLIDKLAANPDNAIQIGHMFFYSGNKIISGLHALVGQVIIPFSRDYKSYVLNRGATKMCVAQEVSNKIFIVHGRDDAAKNEVALFIRNIGLEPIILHLQPNGGRHLLTKFTEESEGAGFAVVLMTPDDEGGLNDGGARRFRARQNVVFELGFFIGKLGTASVAALMKGDVEKPSDFDGIGYITFDSSGRWKTDLARELHHAKIPFDPAKAFSA